MVEEQRPKGPALGDMHGRATQLSDFDVIFEVKKWKNAELRGR